MHPLCPQHFQPAWQEAANGHDEECWEDIKLTQVNAGIIASMTPTKTSRQEMWFQLPNQKQTSSRRWDRQET